MSIVFKHKVNWQYAIGEVVLIFIGITLAIAFNNWNEERKDRNKEKEILLDLAGNIERNNKLLSNTLSLLDEIEYSKNVIFRVLESEQPYSDTLDYHFHMARRRGIVRFLLNKDGYESFKNIGFHILRKKPLKDNIIHLFEVTYVMAQNNAKWTTEVSQGTRASLSSFFYYSGKDNALEPINYEQLLNDKSYKSLLNEIGNARRHVYPLILECLSESQRVHQLIKEELEESE